MNELPNDMRLKIRKYEPIITDGLTLFPVLVREYETFLAVRPALEVLHQSLPVAMMRMPLLSALYKMDYDAATSGKPPVGLFARASLCLALSLRLGEGKDAAGRVNMFGIAVDPKQPNRLTRLHFVDPASGEEKTISPVQFASLRRIIAEQNGIKLENDEANPDIVKAKKNMGASGVALNASVDDLISAAAVITRVDESEIEEWPILKLKRRTEACRRMIDYILCGIGEMQGTTWKGGNPTPHPYFARESEENGLFTDLGSSAPSSKTALPKEAKDVANATINL